MIVIKCKHVNQNEEPQLAVSIKRFLESAGYFPNDVRIITPQSFDGHVVEGKDTDGIVDYISINRLFDMLGM